MESAKRKRSGKDGLVRHRDELEDFERLFGRRPPHGRFEPNVDVWLEEDARIVVVSVELAGAEADALRVVLDDTYLTISGVRAAHDVARSASMLRKEIQYGEFYKLLHLPVPVSDEGAVAVYRDGILTVRLPLAAPTRPPVVRTTLRMTVRRTPA